MSYLGCIGNVRSSSGLEELREVLYAQNTVGHMLSGKALARAVWRHLLVDSALNANVTAEAVNVPLPEVHMAENGEPVEHEPVESHRETKPSKTQAHNPEDLEESIQLDDKLIAGEVLADAVCLVMGMGLSKV